MTNVAPRQSHRFRLMLFVAGGLIGSQAALFLREEWFFYAVALLAGALYIAIHPIEVMGVGVTLLAITSQLFPTEVDELGTAVPGAFRPYILVVTAIAVAVLVGLWLRPSRAYRYAPPDYAKVRGRLQALVVVLLLALIYGCISTMRVPGLLDIMRDCSGWMTFLAFLILTYRLPVSLVESQKAFDGLRLSVLVYSLFFVMKFVLVAASTGAGEAAANFGYSQRDVVFFSGVVLVFLVAEALVRGARVVQISPAIMILLSATFLCGSRSIFGSVLVVSLVFLLLWRPKTRWWAGILALAAVLMILTAQSLDLGSSYDSQDGVAGYVVNRFFRGSAEDASLLARASEMEAVTEAVWQNPLLGRGMTSSYMFFDPYFGWKTTTFVDSGLGYLLMKTGLLGTVAFICFAVAWLGMMGHLRAAFPVWVLAPLACFVFYLAYLPFGPSFFEFQHSWLIGVVSGQAIYVASRMPTRGSSGGNGVLTQPLASVTA